MRQLSFMVDVTTERTPYSARPSRYPDPTGDFCRRGGRFGPHSSNESFSPVYYGRLAFIAYFNAGVRAVDVRDPFHPTEAAFYIPSVTAEDGQALRRGVGRAPLQDRDPDQQRRRGRPRLRLSGDRADTGLHIVELTGPARASPTSPVTQP